MDKALNENIIVKTTPDRKYGLGKNGEAYTLKFGAYMIKGENHLALKWVQVHYASYEKMRALELLKSC